MFSLSKELSNLYGHNITHGTLENVLKRYNDADKFASCHISEFAETNNSMRQ